MNGLRPCFDISRKLVRRPTPANVSRNAQRDKFARAFTWSLLKVWKVTRSEMARNPRTNLGNLVQRNAALLFTVLA